MQQSTTIVSCHIYHLIQRCNERGYSIDEVKDCIISRDNNLITVDTSHPSYPRESKIKTLTTDTIINRSGPGTELKKLLTKIGIKSSPNCSCNARAKIMDNWGPDECEKHIDEIVGWLKEEATKRKLPFVEYAGKLLVKRAISNAKKNAK